MVTVNGKKYGVVAIMRGDFLTNFSILFTTISEIARIAAYN